MSGREFTVTETGYKVRRRAWVVRGTPRGRWVEEVREDNWFDGNKEAAQDQADYWNSVALPERPADAKVIEYIVLEKVVSD